MHVASYKATRPGLQGLANRAIRLRLRGIYSHSEVVFQPGDGVDHLMPDGSCAPVDGAYWCASSVAAERLPSHSPQRAGQMGGVRFKRIALDPAHWDVVAYRRCPLRAAQWFRAHEGDRYDWQLILGFLAWVIPQQAHRWTCSEAAAAAGGYADPWRFDPCTLHVAHSPTPFITSFQPEN